MALGGGGVRRAVVVILALAAVAAVAAVYLGHRIRRAGISVLAVRVVGELRAGTGVRAWTTAAATRWASTFVHAIVWVKR
jgi:hypothetical protein